MSNNMTAVERNVAVIEMLSIPAIRQAVDSSALAAWAVKKIANIRATPGKVAIAAMRALRLANSIVHKHGDYALRDLRSAVLSTLVVAQLAHVNAGGLGAIEAGLVELCRAKRLYPEWPKDLVHQVAIMAEEAGEALDADEDVTKTISDVRVELAQTIAMCLRVLENMEKMGA